jgi:tyrosyl-tRNA synthetase
MPRVTGVDREAILDELEWRGLIAQSTDVDALRKDLAAEPVTLYCGFDPTAESLHAGSLVPLLTLRRFQLFGHRPIVLAGGATGMVGDPSGRSSERQLSTVEEIRVRIESLRPQLERFVDLSGGNALLEDNITWTAPMSALDFLRDVGKHFSVNVMLARESVSARLEAGGISYTEFSYVLLQALDYLELYRRHGCRLQIGGSDQWGNIVAGLDLIRRVEGGSGHALTLPLVTSASGEKFGKSTGGGSLWLDPKLTSPYAFYQYWINVDDRDVGTYLRYFTFLSREQVEELDRETSERPQGRTAQRTLARELTTLVHGERETAQVEAASQALFGQGDLRDLSESTLTAALSEAPHAQTSQPLPSIVDLLTLSGLDSSKSAARRTVADGGAYVNNERVADPDWAPGAEHLLHGRWLVLRKGRRSVAGIDVRRG